MKFFFLCFLLPGVLLASTLEQDLGAQFEKLARAQGFEEAGLVIHKIGSTNNFERTIGGYNLNSEIAVASSSKWISSAVMMSLVDQKLLSLDSLAPFKEKITLRQLLSFQSGLPGEIPCVNRPMKTLAQCGLEITKLKLEHKPGSAFEYGSTHMHLAAYMAEIKSGMDWNKIYRNNIASKLAWPESSRYYTFPARSMGERNPRIAGGLRISTMDYLKFLKMLAQDGVWEGQQVLSKNSIAAMSEDQFTSSTEVIKSPMQNNGKSYHYALGNWVESDTIRSSGGAFGFFPWIDTKHGYVAIFSIEEEARSAQKSLLIVKELRPYIERWLSKK